MANIKIAQLLAANVHFGHKISRWNPKMFPYIYTEKNGRHIIDLVQTSQLLQRACDYVQSASKYGKCFLFVGTKPQAANIIKKEALRSGSFYVNHRWSGGLLTNWRTVKRRINKLRRLESEEPILFATLQKKEASNLRKQLHKLQIQLTGIKGMNELPDVMIVIDQNYEFTAVREAIKLKIPIISILDTNCDPDLINIPIPGNDDGVKSISLIMQTLSDSIIKGRILWELKI